MVRRGLARGCIGGGEAHFGSTALLLFWLHSFAPNSTYCTTYYHYDYIHKGKEKAKDSPCLMILATQHLGYHMRYDPFLFCCFAFHISHLNHFLPIWFRINHQLLIFLYYVPLHTVGRFSLWEVQFCIIRKINLY